MLDHIAPAAARPDRVAMLSRAGCPFCACAKALLADAGDSMADVPPEPAQRSQVLGALANASTVPQVFTTAA